MSKNNINLTDYILERAWGKTEAYNKDEITSLLNIIQESGTEILSIVTQLPTENIKTNHLYLLYNNEGREGNLFDVYVYVDEKWEQLDSLTKLDIDFSQYYTSNELDNLLRAKATKEDLTNVRTSLQTTSTSLTTLYNNLTNFNEALIDFDEDNTNLSSDLTKLKDNLLGFINRVNGMIDEIDTLSGDLTNLNDGLDTTNATLGELDEDLRDLGDNVTTLGTDLTDTKQELITTKGTLTTTKNDLTNLQSEFGETKTSLQNTKNQLNDLEDDLEDFGEEVDRLGGEITTTQTTLSNAQTELSTLKNTTIPTLQGNINTIQGDITGINDDITRLDGSTGDLTNQLGGLNQTLNTTNNNLSGLSTQFTELTTTTNSLSSDMGTLKNTTIPQFTQDITGLNTSLGSLDGRTTSLEGSLTQLRTSNTQLSNSINGLTTDLNNIHNTGGTGLLDTTRTSLSSLTTRANALEESLQELTRKSNQLDASLQSVTEGLANSEGDFLATASDMAELSQKFIDLINDLNTLGDYLTDFEGDVEDFKEGLDEDELSTFDLDDELVNLFGIIGSVKTNVTTIQGDMTTVQEDIDAVQTDVYGTGGSPTNLKNDGLVKKMQTAQTDITSTQTAIQDVQTEIYGNPNDNNDGGIIGALLGNYTPSSTASYTNTISTATNVNRNIGNSYRIKITGNGSHSYIRSSSDGNNYIRLIYNNNKFYLSIRVNNAWVLENVIVKNEYIDVVNNRIIYDNTNYYDMTNTSIVSTNLYQIKGTINVYTLTTVDGGLISEIDNTNTAIDNTNTRIDNVQTDITGVNTAINTANGEITQAKSDINTAKNNISQVQVTMYGSNKDPNNPQANSLVQNLNDVQGDVDDVNTQLYGSGGTPSSPKTGSIAKNLSTAQTNITTAQNNINTITNTTIPSVQNDVKNVKVDLFGGTTSSPGSATNIKGGLAQDLVEFTGNLEDTNTRIDGITNDNNTGVLDVAQAQLTTTTSNLTTVQKKIYGNTGTATNPKNDGLIKKLEIAEGNIEDTSGRLDGAIGDIEGITNNKGTGTLDVAVTNISSATTKINNVTNTNGTGSLDVVQKKIYGTGGSATNLKDDGVLKKIQKAEGDITEAQGLITVVQGDITNVQGAMDSVSKSLIGEYTVSNTASYTYNNTTESQVKQNIGANYRIKLSTNGSHAYIRANNDTQNLIRLIYNNNKFYLSIRVNNVYILENVIVKNPYIEVIGKKIIYDNKFYDISNTSIVTTNLYQAKGKVEVYPITVSEDGLLTVVDNAQYSIGVVQEDISSVQTMMYGTGTTSNPQSGSVMGNIKQAQTDITKAQGTIDKVTNTSGTGSLDKLLTQVGTNTSTTSSTSLWGKVRGALSSITTLEGLVGKTTDNASTNTLWGKSKALESSITALDGKLGKSTDATTGNTVWAKVNNLISGTDSALYKLFGKTNGSTTDYTSGSIWGKIKGIEDGLQGQIDDIKENAPYIYEFELYKVTTDQSNPYVNYYEKVTPNNVKWGDTVLFVLTVKQNNDIVTERLDNMKVTVTPTTGDILTFNYDSMSYVTDNQGNGVTLKNSENQVVGYINYGYIGYFKINGTGLYKISCDYTETTFNIADWIVRDLWYEKYYGSGQIYAGEQTQTITVGGQQFVIVTGGGPEQYTWRLYINPSIRVCRLRYYRSSYAVEEGTQTIEEEVIPSEYFGEVSIVGSAYNPNQGVSIAKAEGGEPYLSLWSLNSGSRALNFNFVWNY